MGPSPRTISTKRRIVYDIDKAALDLRSRPHPFSYSSHTVYTRNCGTGHSTMAALMHRFHVTLLLNYRTRTGLLLLLLTSFLTQGRAQELSSAQPAMFVRANDRFAFDLLEKTHQEARERNIVVAPLPISLIFAALWGGTLDSQSSNEI